MIPAGVVIVADCPAHGERTFLRCEACAWWYCPDRECPWVITDEDITPDGAEPVEWPWSEGSMCSPGKPDHS